MASRSSWSRSPLIAPSAATREWLSEHAVRALGVLQGPEVIATPGHTGGHLRGRGGDGAFDLLICDAAYPPRQYAEPCSDKAPLRAGRRRSGLA